MDLLTPAVTAARSTIEDFFMKTLFPDLEEKIEKIKEAEEEAKCKNLPKGTADELKKSAKEAVKSTVDSVINKVKELGPCLSLLTAGTASLIMQLPLIAVEIIGVSAVGPTVNANAIPSLLQRLKRQGDDLSKVYDDASRLTGEIEQMAGQVPLIQSTVIAPVNAILVAAKAACLMVGSPCGGESAETPSVESPISFTNDPKKCKNYQPTSTSVSNRTCANCTAYEELIAGKERSCNNCKKFEK